MKIPEKNPGVIDRINAVNVICSGPQSQINLEVDPECEELITDLEQVLGDGKQGIKKTFNKKDPYYRRTHTSDALGYWICFEAPVVDKKWDDQTTESIKMPRPSYHRN